MLETAGSLIRQALRKGIRKKKPPEAYPLHPNEDGSWSIGRAPHVGGKKMSTIVGEWQDAGFIPKGAAHIVVEIDMETNSLYLREPTDQEMRQAKARSPK